MTDQILEAEVWGIQQFMLGRDIACMFLTDFAVAYPSIATAWLPRVLVVMQVHPGIVVFFEALYSENTGAVCFWRETTWGHSALSWCSTGGPV